LLTLSTMAGPRSAFVRQFELAREQYQWTPAAAAAHLRKALKGEAAQMVDAWQARLTTDSSEQVGGHGGRQHYKILMRGLAWTYWDDAAKQAAYLRFAQLTMRAGETLVSYRYRVDEARWGLDVSVDDLLRVMQ